MSDTHVPSSRRQIQFAPCAARHSAVEVHGWLGAASRPASDGEARATQPPWSHANDPNRVQSASVAHWESAWSTMAEHAVACNAMPPAARQTKPARPRAPVRIARKSYHAYDEGVGR